MGSYPCERKGPDFDTYAQSSSAELSARVSLLWCMSGANFFSSVSLFSSSNNITLLFDTKQEMCRCIRRLSKKHKALFVYIRGKQQRAGAIMGTSAIRMKEETESQVYLAPNKVLLVPVLPGQRRMIEILVLRPVPRPERSQYRRQRTSAAATAFLASRE
jgi:hypothetical protein